MSETTSTSEPRNAPQAASPRLSVDAWAVVLGLVLAALVRLGVLKHITW